MERVGPHLQVRVGTDLVEVERVTRLLETHGSAAERLFTEGERTHCAGRPRRREHLAARFAAKEAVGKAFGTGVGGAIPWTDIEVVSDPQGRPAIRLHGRAEAWADEHELTQLEVSLSHTDHLALAYVVAVLGTPATPSP